MGQDHRWRFEVIKKKVQSTEEEERERGLSFVIRTQNIKCFIYCYFRRGNETIEVIFAMQ